MSFRHPDCLLVRVGELALKSDPVQRRMFSMLLDNMRAAMKGIKFRYELMPNRMFVYTKDIKKAAKRLQRVFGIVSVSPAWMCPSDLDEIKLLAADVAEKALKLRPSKSFAIRPHRVGKHAFTTLSIAEEAGAAVKKATNAKVNLSKPDVEVCIEVRSNKTYIYAEKIPCAGGLPLGTSGRSAAVVDGKEAAVAAWLIMKRGVELTIFAEKAAKPLVAVLKRWHVGRNMHLHGTGEMDELAEIAEKRHIQTIIGTMRIKKALQKKIDAAGLLLLQPTAGWTADELSATASKMGINSRN